MELKELINLLEKKNYIRVEKNYDSKPSSASNQTKRLPRYIISTEYESVYQKLREYDNYSQKGYIHSYEQKYTKGYTTLIYVGEDIINFLEQYDCGKEKVKVPINLYEDDVIRQWIDEFTRYTYDSREYSVSFTTYTYFINDDVRNRRLEREALKKKEVDEFIKNL